MAATRTSSRAAALAAGALLGAVALVALHVAHGLEYWNYSEGVYAYTSRLLLHDGDLYGHVVVAQPPWEFLFGAAALALHDSLGFLRAAVGAAQLAAGLLAALAVWRLTASRAATAAAPALMLLTPWAVHEHGALTPELLAPAVLLAAALLATRAEHVPLAAVLAAITPFLKWPFALALVAIVAFSAAPWTAARWALGALVVQAVVFTLLLGTGLWDDTVLAQLHSGRRGFDVLKGVWAQAVWSLGGLVALAALAFVRRRTLRDAALLRVLTALAVAMLLTLSSNTKDGTGLNVLVPVEAALLPLALAGAARAGTRAMVIGAAVALVFTFAQSASLLAVTPTATPFLYPGSERGAWGEAVPDAEVDRIVAAARTCPEGVPFSGPPFLAFLAERPMPDGQPDQFLPAHSTSLAGVAARMAAVAKRCP